MNVKSKVMNKEFDVDKLYDIVTRLKHSMDERKNTKAVLQKNPSNVMYLRAARAKLEYMKALKEFNSFIERYTDSSLPDDEE